jgi:universal stress protein A
MVSFKKLILTTDFSTNADAAIPYAVELARKYDGKIFLVHVASLEIAYTTLPTAELVMVGANARLERMQEENKGLMQRAEKLAAEHHIEIVPILRVGDAVSEIVNFAKEEKADAIVISTRGLKGLSHLVWGSVAERIVRQSPCTVISVHPEAPKP